MAATINQFPVVPYANFFRYSVAVYLTDADATVHPDATGSTVYIIPPNTLTAARTLTVDDTGPTTTQVAQFIRYDTSAHNYVIQRSTGPTTLWTTTVSAFAASGIYPLYQAYYTGGIWQVNSLYYVQQT